MRDALQQARDALFELVRLRKLARDANNLETSGSWENVRKQREWLDECAAKVPLAYEAARDALDAANAVLAEAPPSRTTSLD